MLNSRITVIEKSHLFALTENRDGSGGLKLGVAALQHVHSRVGYRDGVQSERSGEHVD